MAKAHDIEVSEATLPSIIEGEIARSIGHWTGTLAEERAQEFDYYYGRPFGNEVEGESQVVSTDVADTIEGMLPIILAIFTASDDVVRFEPNGPEDEEQAKQQTEVSNYVFYRQNNGFLVLYQWFKDALIQKNGIVKYWWDKKQSMTKESYEGLTDQEYASIVNDASYMEVEVLEHTERPDPMFEQKIEAMRAQMQAQAPPEAMMQLEAQIAAQPVPQIHDVTIRLKKDESKICIEAIPPEEFGISAQHNCISIQDTNFCFHRTRKSFSTLRMEGCPEEILEQVGSTNEEDTSPESLARDRFLTDTWRDKGADATDRVVWVTECYIRVDFDGDGVAELRHVILVAREVWVNDETDHICFAALTPIIMPHRWIGRSVAEMVMDIQFQKSVLWRQMFNNLYLTNNPRKAVLSSAGGIVQANLDDLLTSRPGGIMREYVPNAIRNEETPFVAGASFPMLEYLDSVKETRTGVTRYNQGTDADTLNKTARGIQMIQAAGAQRTSLIARIFAETGVKDLMRGITHLLSKYSSKAMTVRLRNQWVNVDPRQWKTLYDMTINVGLGTGNKDVQLAHLNALHMAQVELMKTGRGYMVSDENLYNLYTKMSEAMGFKHPELFVTDPQRIPQQAKQPPPNPDLLKIQAEGQQSQAKLQADGQKVMVQAKVDETLKRIESETDIKVANIGAASAERIAQMKINADAQTTVFEAGQEKSDPSREQAILTKATELDVREIKVGYEEQILQLKKQVEQMAEAHRGELSEQSVGRAEKHEQDVVKRMQSTIDAISREFAQLAKVSSEHMKRSSEVITELQKPQAVRIEKIQTDSKGRITGAEVRKSIQ